MMRRVRATGLAGVATIGLVLIGLMVSGARGGADSGDAGGAIAFPTEYRTWAHVKTVLVGPESAAFKTEAGFHHIYANDKALIGYRTGHFPDGAVVVYDLLDTKVVSGNTLEGSQRRLDVMIKASQRYPDTAGWGFASFPGGNRTDGALPAERSAGCFRCHGERKNRDYIISEFRP